MKVFIIGWTSLLENMMPVIHECYLAAFRAVSSDRVGTWTRADTYRLQGVSPDVIWCNKALWGDYGFEARNAFYRHFAEFPVAQVRQEAFDTLCRLDKQKVPVYLVSLKSKELMLKEVGNAGLATYAKAFFASDGKHIYTREILLQKVMRTEGWGNDFVVVSSSWAYKKAADALGCGFVPATFRGLNSL